MRKTRPTIACLKLEGGHEPRNMGSRYKLENKEICSPLAPQKTMHLSQQINSSPEITF